MPPEKVRRLDPVAVWADVARMQQGFSAVSVQRQLKEDWDNREFNYLIAENVKRIADSLGQFGECFPLRLCRCLGSR